VRTSPYSEDNQVNLNHDIINIFKLLLSRRKNNSPEQLSYIHTILSKLGNIFSNKSTAEVFAYFCKPGNGAATAWILQNKLGIPEATVYRVLKDLRASGMIAPAIIIPKIKGSKGGPRATIWAIVGCSKDDIAQAFNLHRQLKSRKYRIAVEVAQTMLDSYIKPRRLTEISYREIIIHIKELRVPFRTPDIADLAAQYLHEQGVKVWR